MTAFQVGRVYRLYQPDGASIRCVGRWWDGTIEMVTLAFDGPGVIGAYHDRTALTVRGIVFPRVSVTLGGVTWVPTCHHDWYPSHVADDGPYAGHLCCEACGWALDVPPPSEDDWPHHGAHVPSCTHQPHG